MENVNEEQKISKYNQALSALMRLDGLWQEFIRRMLEGKMIKARFICDRIWGELSADASEEDIVKNNEFQNTFVMIGQDINKKYGKKIKEQYGPDDMKEHFDKIYEQNIYTILNQYETFLRTMQNKQGKGSAYLSKDEENLD